MEFDAEMVDLAEAHFRDFLQASGFELPLSTDEDHNTGSRIDEWLALAEDHMWDDAFEAKFGIQAAQMVNDGIPGATGADIIQLPTK